MAKANNIELEYIERTPEKPFPPEYKKINPLDKVPSFEGADGYVLTECIAIAVYSESHVSPFDYILPALLDEKIIHFSYPCLKYLC